MFYEGIPAELSLEQGTILLGQDQKSNIVEPG